MGRNGKPVPAVQDGSAPAKSPLVVARLGRQWLIAGALAAESDA